MVTTSLSWQIKYCERVIGPETKPIPLSEKPKSQHPSPDSLENVNVVEIISQRAQRSRFLIHICTLLNL